MSGEKENTRKTIFAANAEMGSALAMVPALVRLRDEGHNIVTLSFPEEPAYAVFQSAGLRPRFTASHISEVEMISAFLEEEKPDLLVVGVSTRDDGSEKIAMKVAHETGTPLAFIVETWPHHWLNSYGERDIPLYRRADLAMLVDEFSCGYMAGREFDRTQLRATGNPVHDYITMLLQHREEIRHETRQLFDISRDAVVIQWSMALDLDDPTQDRPEHPEWSGCSERESVKEFLAAIRDVNEKKPPRKVVGIIRQKPSHGATETCTMITEICPSVIFDNGSKSGRPLLMASDVVVGAVTMMVQDAAMFQTIGINYLPDLLPSKPKPIANTLGFTIGMHTRGDLRRLIFQAGHDPNFDLFTRAKIRPLELPTDATANVVNEIETFLTPKSA